ncbi:MAG: hypothetical protein Q4E13_14910, partial [Clostridia bacterium]|nr:hypothetical protein [Clostridia bacterium]
STEQTQNGLRFSARRAIAIDNLYALEWTIENVSSAPRLLLLDSMKVDELEGAFSGHSLSNVVLLPGESQMGYAKCMVPGVEGETCRLSLGYFEYGIEQNAIPEDRSRAVYPEEDQVQFLCEDRFALDVARSFGPEWTIDSRCFDAEVALGAVTLRLSDAQLCISNSSFTFEGACDTREEALANDPCGANSGWGVQLKFDPGVPLSEWIDGTEWIAIGGG